MVIWFSYMPQLTDAGALYLVVFYVRIPGEALDRAVSDFRFAIPAFHLSVVSSANQGESRSINSIRPFFIYSVLRSSIVSNRVIARIRFRHKVLPVSFS